ncbi:MAG: hypothetical protein QOE86_2980 [Solirubrobacteraceae bacterium]|jgi:hypothetical protein|nr:hypothetical protein [Solirubrobacteraceae bacterium]
MEPRKAQQVERLHAQITQDGYEIDPDAIAEAILQRLLVGGGLTRSVAAEDRSSDG